MRRLTMMGSGTSSGVPMIGCRCAVCTSADPRNRRMRPGLRLDLAGGAVVVDTSPDLRARRFEDPRRQKQRLPGFALERTSERKAEAEA